LAVRSQKYLTGLCCWSFQLVGLPEAVDPELFDRGFEQKKNSKEQGNVVATEEEQQEEEEEAHISQRTFSFLSIFKWEWRKGWDILLQVSE
jgi:hypothetical protein